ncbi:MAG TPA: GAF domain-containing protein [Nocardioides sp.]|nr:GAF domain-containing protein [Nocardioides sp.]
MSARTAWVLAALTSVFVVADIAVTAAHTSLFSEESVAVHGFPFTQAAVFGSAIMGAVILSRYERHAVGVLLSVIGLTSSFSLLTEAYHVWVIEEGGPGSATLASIAGWISLLLGGQFAFALLALMFLLAPDGHFLSPRWRWAARVIGAGLLLCSLVLASVDPTSVNLRDADVGGVRGPVFSLGFFMVAGGLVASLVSMWIRFRRSRGEERRQLLLIAIAVAALVIGLANLLVVQAFNGGEQDWAAALPLLVAYVLLPLLFALAALRYRLYDIEVVVNRTVVLAVGFAFAAVGYTTVVVVVGRLVDTRTGGLVLSLLATALVAIAFQPLRRAVIRLANRIAYGARAQPYEALSDFSRRLADTPTSSELLPAVAEAAGLALAARRVAVTCQVADSDVVWDGPTRGDPSGESTASHVVPVRSGSQVLGSIRVDLLETRPLRPADERLLTALADQAAVAFRNTAMETQLEDHVAELDRTTRELVESRARILEADVDARRLLEEAISREVLPRLSALPERLREARVAVEGGAANGLEALVSDTNSALEELRELTRGVFPTQLARVGIVPTLRSFLGRTDPAPTLEVDDTAATRRFPERVETAVYFCCVEATRLGPSSMKLSIADVDLVLEIAGLGGSAADLRPVLDRVEAVGGSLSVVAGALELRIPVDQEAAADQVSDSRSGPKAALATYAAAPDPSTSN